MPPVPRRLGPCVVASTVVLLVLAACGGNDELGLPAETDLVVVVDLVTTF